MAIHHVSYHLGLLCFPKGLLLECKEALFALQNDYCWIEKGVHFIANVLLFRNSSLHISSENIVICCATAYYAKPLKTREFRAKDFFARSVRSFERLKMQRLCWDVG